MSSASWETAGLTIPIILDIAAIIPSTRRITVDLHWCRWTAPFIHSTPMRTSATIEECRSLPRSLSPHQPNAQRQLRHEQGEYATTTRPRTCSDTVGPGSMRSPAPSQSASGTAYTRITPQKRTPPRPRAYDACEYGGGAHGAQNDHGAHDAPCAPSIQGPQPRQLRHPRRGRRAG